MNTVPSHSRLFLWWLGSAIAMFGIGMLSRAIVREPPFNDWFYIVGMALVFPSVFIPLWLWLARNKP